MIMSGILVMGAPSARAVAAPMTPTADDALFRVRDGGRVTVDGGLVLALPVALGTGLSTGVGAGVSAGTRHLAWGARASWSTATESSIDWTVTQSDLKLRVVGAVQQPAGRGRFALRLGVGTTVVHETRLRNQGMRAGATGSALASSAYDAAPAGDLEAVVAVHVAGPWLLVLSAGPSLTVVDGDARWGWTTLLGVGWQP